jgi:hypothetical protein
MEQLREVKIIVIVETNKGTYQEEFATIEEAKEFLNNTLNGIPA